MIARAELRRASWRLLGAWLCLSIAGYLGGEKIVELCRPLLGIAISIIGPDYSNALRIVDKAGERHLLLDAHALRPIPLGAGITVPPLQALPASASVVHILVPIVILFSVILAWPARNAGERLRMLAYGVPGGLAVLLLTTPAQLVGLIEIALQEYATSHGSPRPTPYVLNWMFLMEGGGNWVLPVGVALLAVAAARRTQERRSKA